MHMRLLPGEKTSWYVRDIAFPTVLSGVVVCISYLLHPLTLGRTGEVAWIFCTGCIAYLAAALGAAEFRRYVRDFSFKPMQSGIL
jgi:hypothetical protein